MGVAGFGARTSCTGATGAGWRACARSESQGRVTREHHSLSGLAASATFSASSSATRTVTSLVTRSIWKSKPATLILPLASVTTCDGSGLIHLGNAAPSSGCLGSGAGTIPVSSVMMILLIMGNWKRVGRLWHRVEAGDDPFRPRHIGSEQDVQPINRLIGRRLVTDQRAHRHAVHL